MVHYAALFFVYTDNPEIVLNEWLNHNNYPKVVVITSTDLTQLWEKIQQAKLSVNEDLNGGE